MLFPKQFIRLLIDEIKSKVFFQTSSMATVEHSYGNNFHGFLLTIWTPEAGIPAARYINATARSRYTGGTVLNAPGQKPIYRICFLMRTGTGMLEP